MKHFYSLVVLMLTLLAPVLAADPTTHVVQKGETLYGIALKYGAAVDAIISANGIKDASKLQSGTRILIPGPPAASADAGPGTGYTVEKGDTLYGISRKFGLGIDSIQKANSLSGTTIKPGQVLIIPGTAGRLAEGSTTAAPTPKPATSTQPAGSPGKAETQPGVAPLGSTPVKDATPGKAATGVPSVPVAVKTPAWPIAGTVSYLQGKLKGATITGQAAASLIAVRAGTVISAGPFRGFGRVAFVQSVDGLVYVYGGAESLNVKVGDSVRRGMVLGELGDGEECIAYFFVFKGQDAIDPASAPRD